MQEKFTKIAHYHLSFRRKLNISTTQRTLDNILLWEKLKL